MTENTVGIHMDENRLIPSSFAHKEQFVGNIKCRTERAKGYPVRAKFYEGMPWRSLKENGYNPPEYTAQVVFSNDKTQDPNNSKLWADPADTSNVDHPFLSFEGILKIDKNGRPLNPKGPTGITGRGLLGLWGANWAVDAVVTKINDQEQLEIAIINRSDTGQHAIPGGMVDRGEDIVDAMNREFKEETTSDLDFTNAEQIYEGYVDDPRNTDNAWMETSARHLHLPADSKIDLVGNEEEGAVRWALVDAKLLGKLYGSHANTVKLAVSLWQEKNHKVIDKNGFVKED